MSTSMLYHTFGVRTVQHISTDFFDGKTIFRGVLHPNSFRCAVCASHNVIRSGSCARTFKMLPVGHRKTELVVEIPRLQCKNCGTIRQPRLDFAEPKKHFTKSLERFVIDLCQITTIDNVAELTGLGWDTVKEIHKQYLYRKYKKIKLKKVRYIAIDEIYLGKKRKFITIVLDLDSGRVIHIGQGKGKAALLGFWERLKRSKAKIKAVATDMASGYISAALEHIPDADLVLDHFHLVKWFNDKLSTLRRQLYRIAGKAEKDVLKGSRWLLIKAQENLKPHADEKRDEKKRLEKALGINKPLAIAYYMKEKLRLMFQCHDKQKVEAEIHAWIQQANSSGIKILKDAAKKIQIWRPFILNWHNHPISTSKLEATNRKIGLLQRIAHGYRDEQYLKLRIYNLHTNTYALSG